jgi:hypothetical protein
MAIITRGDARTQPGHFAPAILETFRQNHQVFSDIFDANGS